MIHVSIRYYNIVADYLGRREEQRSLDEGTTVGVLLESLAAESKAFGRLALPALTSGSPGSIGGQVRLFRNGRAVIEPDQVLADGDELRLFPAISGG